MGNESDKSTAEPKNITLNLTVSQDFLLTEDQKGGPGASGVAPFYLTLRPAKRTHGADKLAEEYAAPDSKDLAFRFADEDGTCGCHCSSGTGHGSGGCCACGSSVGDGTSVVLEQ